MKIKAFLALCSILTLLLTVSVGCRKSSATETLDDLPSEQASAVSPEAKVAPTKKVVQVWTFEENNQGWGALDPKVKVSAVPVSKHEGAAGLRVEGVSPQKLWGFIGSPVFKLEPKKDYRITLYMKVDNWSDPAFSPTMKCMLMKDGAFFANTFSNKYDLNRKGEWQEMTIKFYSAEQDNQTALIGLEKGTADKAITCDISIDDVKVEIE